MSKININDVLNTLKRTKPFYLVIALVLFVISKVVAALRINLYFHQLKVFLTQKSNLQLSLLGMFYNLFFPGGFGGDTYKGYLIKKKFNVDTKKIVSALVLDRLSGLLLLFIYACFLAFTLRETSLKDYNHIIIVSIILAPVIFWLLSKKLFGFVFPVFWKSLGYSALVQLAQLISVYYILKSLSIEVDVTAYLFVFLISSIISVLPLTFGGIGSREVTFFYGSLWLNLNQNTSISVAMAYFLITMLVSLLGSYYHFKKLELVTLNY